MWESSVPDRCEGKTLELGIDESLVVGVAVVQSEAAQLDTVDEGDEGYIGRRHDFAVQYAIHSNRVRRGVKRSVGEIGRVRNAE